MGCLRIYFRYANEAVVCLRHPNTNAIAVISCLPYDARSAVMHALQTPSVPYHDP